MIKLSASLCQISKDNSNAPGIRPSTNKFQRFNVVVPLFKTGKMYFPKDKKLNPALIEMLEEIRLVSYGGFKSKHDDAIDTVSMLALLKTYKPSEVIPMASTNNVYYVDDTRDDYVNTYIV